ncbi:MAG: glycoside hydrolase family 2 TIM barrel-domain containing protein, partial [Candidatus Methylacidiphilales bacterium]
NRFDFDRAPMHEPWFDFYQYGGIVRDVFLHVLPRQSLPWITGVYVTPELISSDSGAGSEGWVNVDISIRCNHASRPELTDLGIEIDGTLLDFIPVREKSLQDEASDTIRIQARLKVPHARVWSPETPHLHTLRVILSHRNAPMDDFGARFGLRTIEARDGALWLNGQRLVLKGFNRHEWHPGSGPCTSPLQMLADLQHLRAMGCNFIRGAHYPQDQRFLDLCDSLGFLVWEENLGWGQREKTFASTLWQQHHAATLEAMVRTSFNHPSVIIWGFLNEAGTNQRYTRDTIEACAALLRRLDPSRPITYASMFGLTDLHFDLVDIISLNTYPGWYGCEQVAEPLETIEPAIKELVEHLDASGHSAKPVLISEIGAEALYGWRDTHHDFFTEEYQAEYLRRACHAALGNPRCSGIALWHFSDIRTYSGGRSLLRPRTFNNKGVMDEYRRPKVAYGVVRQAFAELGTPSHATSCGK